MLVNTQKENAMSTTYNWEISALNCYPASADQANLVFNVHWRLFATDGIHTDSIYGTQAVAHNPDDEFIAYAGLTEDIVVGWIESAMGEEAVVAMKAGLENAIVLLSTPPVVTPELPWIIKLVLPEDTSVEPLINPDEESTEPAPPEVIVYEPEINPITPPIG